MNNFRHSGRPSIQLSPRGGKSNCLLSLRERIEVRVGRNPANKKVLLAFILMTTSVWYESVNANEIGRLFYTPQQRQQLDSGTAINNSSPEGERRDYIIVNGVVQKHGGNRTVWINGAAQATEPGNDRNPTTAPVAVPGKPQPVQLKVGQKLLLEPPAPEENK
ncbi:hypothetical protein GALL_93460 [mine drainage metagenome]|uniref:Uncharacterized protein n=1 Tax=mine drainage metagenome TaxID=410659 RepID=A0A1J5SWY3_9ZZZZ